MKITIASSYGKHYFELLPTIAVRTNEFLIYFGWLFWSIVISNKN